MAHFADDFTEDPWWWRDAPPVAYPEPPAASADVVVVGGGYAGLACAAEVAAGGRSVMVLDVRRIGEGASGRNAGLVSGRAGISKMIDLEAHVGAEHAAAILDEADEAYAHFKTLVADHAPGAYHDSGRFVAARSPVGYRKLAKKFTEYQEARGTAPADPGLELVAPDDVGRFIASDAFHGGMAAGHAGLAHPALFVDGLRRRAEAAGASIHTGVRVVDIDTSGDGPHTVTIASGSGTARSRRRIAADEVVLTTNGYTDRVAPWHRERIVPMSSSIIAFEPLGRDRVEELLPAMTAVIDTNRVIVYVRPTPDGEGILFGGRAKFRPISTEASAAILYDQLIDVFPSLDGIKITNAWSGLMAFTPDYLPKVGRLPDDDATRDRGGQPGLWYALGCNGGSGVVLMPWLGGAVGRRLAGTDGGEGPLSTLEDAAFERHVLGRHTSKFVAAAGVWYRLRDEIDNRRR